MASVITAVSVAGHRFEFSALRSVRLTVPWWAVVAGIVAIFWTVAVVAVCVPRSSDDRPVLR